MVYFFSFVFGLAIGSFINCLVYRLNRNLSPFQGRSVCPQCKHQLAWHDNIPLFSFVFLRGKCCYCQKPISLHYPLVELATALFTLFVIYHISIYDIRSLFYFLLIGYALIAIFVSDLLYQTIPDEIVYPAIILALIRIVATGLFGQTGSWLPLLAGLGAAGFFLFLVLVTRGKGMGLGDVKLVALMGLALGWPAIIISLFLAFLTGAVTGAILVLVGKKGFKDQVPFGPFLAGSTMLLLFWGEKISYWVENFLGI